MTDEVLERMIATYMATDQPTYSFGWQGGEPTLMGVDFFRRITELEQRCGRPGAMVANGLQTNATLITDEMAAHLGEYSFLVGVSIDGPSAVHDRYRRTVDGRGSLKAVLKGLDHLKRNKVEYNVLILVSAANVERPAETYDYVNSLGARFHQYIPCVEFDQQGRRLPFAINGKQWGDFLCGVFERWIRRDTRQVSIRLFDSVLTLMVEGHPSVCYMDRNCCQYFVVEHNGDVYPCDFFVEKELLLGNVMHGEWRDFLESPVYKDFGRRKSRFNEECADCEYLEYCAADCPKQRFYGTQDPTQRSFLCEGWKAFYSRTLPEFRRLAGDIRRERELEYRRRSLSTGVPEKLPRPNDPCYCGSGRKFKHCHGRL